MPVKRTAVEERVSGSGYWMLPVFLIFYYTDLPAGTQFRQGYTEDAQSYTEERGGRHPDSDRLIPVKNGGEGACIRIYPPYQVTWILIYAQNVFVVVQRLYMSYQDDSA